MRQLLAGEHGSKKPRPADGGCRGIRGEEIILCYPTLICLSTGPNRCGEGRLCACHLPCLRPGGKGCFEARRQLRHRPNCWHMAAIAGRHAGDGRRLSGSRGRMLFRPRVGARRRAGAASDPPPACCASPFRCENFGGSLAMLLVGLVGNDVSTAIRIRLDRSGVRWRGGARFLRSEAGYRAACAGSPV